MRTLGVVRRVSGADRYATSAAILADVEVNHDAPVVVATGAAFPDALAAGAVNARLGGGLLLVPPLQAEQAAEVLRSGGWSSGVLLGGPAAVSITSSRALVDALTQSARAADEPGDAGRLTESADDT